jgi:hypothetical protein
MLVVEVAVAVPATLTSLSSELKLLRANMSMLIILARSGRPLEVEEDAVKLSSGKSTSNSTRLK